MAKKKKRKHGGGRPAWYSKYQFQGSNLSPAQKAYNEEIRKAAGRIREWEKKLSKKEGREVKLDLLPTVPKQAKKQRVQEIREITWNKLGKAIEREEEANTYIQKMIAEISDIMPHFDYNLKWLKQHDLTVQDWLELKETYRDKMISDIQRAADQKGRVLFYRQLVRGEKVRELQRIAYSIYELASDADPVTCPAHKRLYSKFNFILTGQAMNDIELRSYATATVDDLYQNNSGWWTEID